MIVKMREPVSGFKPYVRRKRVVLAMRMPEDFLVETWFGFVSGGRDDYLVEIDDDIRIPIHAEAFIKTFRPYDDTQSCGGECAEHDKRSPG